MVAQEPDWLKYDKGEPKKEKPAAIAAMSAGRTSICFRANNVACFFFFLKLGFLLS